jgi:hypothetical protein
MTDASVPASIPEAVEKLADMLYCKKCKVSENVVTIVLDPLQGIELTLAPDDDDGQAEQRWQFQITLRRRAPSHDPKAIADNLRAALGRAAETLIPRFPQ